MRRAALLLVLILAVGAGVAAGSVFAPHDHAAHDHEESFESLEPDGGAETATLAPDPVGGPAWGVRTYRSRTGLTCPNAGRVDQGRFGRVDEEGGHVELPVGADGACADLAVHPLAIAIKRYAARQGQGERGVVFGAASDEVVRLAYRGPDGAERRLEPAPTGAFLAVESDAQLAGATLTVATADGGSRVYRLDD